MASRYVAELLATVHGGRVLDVGTGSGRFARFLAESLASYDEIIGVDNQAVSLTADRRNVVPPRVRFVRADAASLPFPDSVFDTVASSNLLHHLADVNQSLTEMLRVLRSGGRMIIAEMFAQPASPAQELHQALHGLLAEINRHVGITHNRTMTRDELLALYHSLPLDVIQVFEVAPDTEPVKELENSEFVGRIRQRLATVREQPEYQKWQRRAEGLFEQARRIGLQSPNQLWFVGIQP